MKLHFTKSGQGAALVILHGLFGSADNWSTLGKKLADHYTVYLVDQRNHGRSPHSNDFSYELLANDLCELFDDEKITEANILGHSMGGKTAMRFAQLFPERVLKLMVVDIGVKAYPPQHKSILDGLKAIDLDTLSSRNDADEQMQQYISDFGTRQFLLKSLYRKNKNHFGWRINIAVLEAKMSEITKAIPYDVVEVPALFVSGSKSDYIKEEDQEAIKEIFTAATFEQLHTGHWVHAEDPDGLERIIRNFVTS